MGRHYRSIIHIGLPKTATTLFQERLFKKAAERHYIGPGAYKKCYSQAKRIFSAETFENQDIESLKDLFITDKPIFFSDEAIGNGTKVPRIEKYNRVSSLIPNAKWVITLRNPLDMLESIYLWDIHSLKRTRRHFRSLERWFDSRWGAYTSGNHKCNVSPVDGGQIAKELTIYAGRDDVDVLLFEDFIYRKEQYVAQFSSYLGIETDLSLQYLGDTIRNRRLTRDGYSFLSCFAKSNDYASVLISLEFKEWRDAQESCFEEKVSIILEKYLSGQQEAGNCFFEIFDFVNSNGVDLPRNLIHDFPLIYEAVREITDAGFCWVKNEFGLDLDKYEYF
ncbi:MAG: hypothetical protein AAGH40_12610 [Verrucomicrobiota bacterium]